MFKIIKYPPKFSQNEQILNIEMALYRCTLGVRLQPSYLRCTLTLATCGRRGIVVHQSQSGWRSLEELNFTEFKHTQRLKILQNPIGLKTIRKHLIGLFYVYLSETGRFECRLKRTVA